jgi:excisionase family DNA binding protein
MKDFYTTTEIADLMNINRVTVFRWIKEGKLKAIKPGRNYIVPFSSLPQDLQAAIQNNDSPDKNNEEEIRAAVKRVVKEYGATLKKLGEE